jgi:V/A-type H+-transporting ATPase subunit K
MIKNKRVKIIMNVVFSGIIWSVFLPPVIHAAENVQANAGGDWMGVAYIAAALAVGLACIASGYAVARIGSAAIGAVSEKPELTGRTLVFIGLAEGIAIYGLIIAIMILNKL